MNVCSANPCDIHVFCCFKDLQNLLDNAKYGVIYVSWGSLIKAHTMPEDKRVAMVNAFRRMNQTILWKYENDTMPETADNLHIRRWMPQLEILCKNYIMLKEQLIN